MYHETYTHVTTHLTPLAGLLQAGFLFAYPRKTKAARGSLFKH